MIIQNGTIQTLSMSGEGGLDPKTGFPVNRTETQLGDAIPCQYTANQYNNLGRTKHGESFTVAQYSILIEQPREPFTAKRLRLTDMSGNALGDFSVMSVEALEGVCQLRIVV